MSLLILYDQCRVQLPTLTLNVDDFEWHLHRAFRLYYRASFRNTGEPGSCDNFLKTLRAEELYIASAYLENDVGALHALQTLKVGDKTLCELLRACVSRRFPGNPQQQNNAFDDFWGHLLVPGTGATPAPLARYDGHRPLGPWLVTVFQNLQLTTKRKLGRVQALADSELELGRHRHCNVISRWNGRELPEKIDSFVELPVDGLTPSKRVDAILAFIPPDKANDYLDAWMGQRIGAIQQLLKSALDRKPRLKASLPKIVDGYCNETTDKKDNRNMQRIRDEVVPDLLSRREFLPVVAVLFGSFAMDLDGAATTRHSLWTKEEMQALLQYTSELRLLNGDIVTCRQILDRALQDQLRCWKQGSRRSADAEVLWDLLDQHFAVALDGYDTRLVDADLAELKSLLSVMGKRRRLKDAQRLQQNGARRFFHTDCLNPAGQIAKEIIKGDNPEEFAWQVLRDERHGDEFQAIMQVFEVGTFCGGVSDNEYCAALWNVAHQRCLAVDNAGGAGRVLGRMLAKDAEDHWTDPRRALANAEQLKILPADVPQIQTYPLWRIQNQLAVFRCLLIAGKDDDAVVLFNELASEILRLGYSQGAVRLWRACRLARKPLRADLILKAQDLMRASSLQL